MCMSGCLAYRRHINDQLPERLFARFSIEIPNSIVDGSCSEMDHAFFTRRSRFRADCLTWVQMLMDLRADPFVKESVFAHQTNWPQGDLPS